MTEWWNSLLIEKQIFYAIGLFSLAILLLQIAVGALGFGLHVWADWHGRADTMFQNILSGAPPFAPRLTRFFVAVARNLSSVRRAARQPRRRAIAIRPIPVRQSSFPRKRESREAVSALALDPRFCGGDGWCQAGSLSPSGGAATSKALTMPDSIPK
jgi:hypothetical protein